MSYRFILFDYDGTIADTTNGIIDGVRYIMKLYNRPSLPYEEMKKFVGPPLAASLMNYAGFSADEVGKAREDYRAYYAEHCLKDNPVFPGVEQLLQKLCDDGKPLAVATSKYQPIVEAMLHANGIYDYFTVISGQHEGKGRMNKQDCIEYALQKLGVRDRADAVIIGDRFYDVLGAKASGIDCIGVTYGVGDYRELYEAGAKFVCDTAEDVYRYL